jgi:hypothetical protein
MTVYDTQNYLGSGLCPVASVELIPVSDAYITFVIWRGLVSDCG